MHRCLLQHILALCHASSNNVDALLGDAGSMQDPLGIQARRNLLNLHLGAFLTILLVSSSDLLDCTHVTL
jgi:hypothetical protein